MWSVFSLCLQNFRLLCPDGTTNTVDNYATCNWGEVASNVIMTSAVRDPETVASYKAFLRLLEQMYGPNGFLSSKFKLFTSETTYPADVFKRVLTRKNLMFSDMTKKFADIGSNTYYSWVGEYSCLLSNLPGTLVTWLIHLFNSEVKKKNCRCSNYAIFVALVLWHLWGIVVKVSTMTT